MHYPRSKKGFTLVEIVVAIVVISLVFGMTTMMAVSISGYNKEKTHLTQCHEELVRVQSFINNWTKSLDDAFNTNYTVSANNKQLSVKSGLYWFKDANHSFDLWYNENTKTITGDFYINGKLVTYTETYSKVVSIQFALGSEMDLLANTAKCVIVMDDQSVYTMLLQKESSKQGLPVIFSKPFEKKVGSYNEFIFITSADWDKDLNQTAYKNLEDISNLSDFSAAYQYSALSMLQVQVDHQNRMSLEAFTSTYGGKWKVRLFSASGKIAYGMQLEESSFKAASHRLSFFIATGSVLYDGTPIEPMGYTRNAGGIGTQDWHAAAELTYSMDKVADGYDWIIFDTNIFWDEMDSNQYNDLQLESIRRLYGLSDEFGTGVQLGIFVTVDGVHKSISAYGGAVHVAVDNQGPNGTVRVKIGLAQSTFAGHEYVITFTDRFMLPDGTPLREENTFRCKSTVSSSSDFKKAVSVTAGGEYFSGSSGTSSANPLLAYKTFNIDYFIHTPWTDTSRSEYLNLQNKSTAKSAYGLSDDFFNALYNYIYIGLDGNELTLSEAVSKYKFAVSLHKDGSERTILRLSVNTSDMTASNYPMDLTSQVLGIRFGYTGKSGSNPTMYLFRLPNETPVRNCTLARPAAEYTASLWLPRHTLSSKVSSTDTGTVLSVNLTSNGPWIFGQSRFENVLTNNQGFSTAFINSLKNKISVKLGGSTGTIAEWGVSNFDVDVFESNGRWAITLKFKNSITSGKTLSFSFKDGFVGPDGTTLIIPITIVRDGANSWTGSTSSDLYYPNRTVSINNTSGSAPSMTVSLPSGSYSGTTPFYIYARIKLEGAKAINSGSAASATIVLDYTSSTDVTLATLTADTDGWVNLSDLYGQTASLKKENANIVFKMNNMAGKFTIADLIVADKNGNIKYSMANDTTLYGVGDVRNTNKNYTTWGSTTTAGTTFPIITRGDALYLPNRVLKMTVKSSYTGGDASFIINEGDFSSGVTYYVTGRIRANITGKTANSNAGSNNANIVVSGAGENKYYGVPNGEWVALTNADGTPLSFIGGITEIPKTLTTPHRTIAIHAKHDMTNGKMTIQTDAATARFGANQKLIVRGYYQVTDFTSVASGACYEIGDGASSGKITSSSNQSSWKYFKLEWNTNTNLNFEFHGANGYLRLANLTIENTSGTIVYDLSTDSAIDSTYRTGFPWAPSIWYITYFGDPDAMDFSVEKVGSSTPKQYTTTRTETVNQTITSVHRQIAIHAKNNVTYSRMAIQVDQFKSKIGTGTYIIRGYYQVTDFTTVTSGGYYEIGSGATGKITGTSNQTSWKYFQLTWTPGNDSVYFSLVNANGYLRLANVTIENSSYNVVYDLATDTAIDSTYRTSFPWAPSIWYITYSGEPDAMDCSIGAVTSATPKQYSIKTEVVPINTVSSVKRSMGLASSGQTINAKMILYGSKFAAAKGSGTYTVRGYYKVTSYASLGSGNHYSIGTGATSGNVTGSSSVGTWTRFELKWNTSKDLVFEFWMATGGLYLGNVVIENSSGTWLYDLSTDSAVPSGYYNTFPKENGYWYWGYSTNTSYPTANMSISIGDVSSGSPGWFNYKYTEVPTTTISSAKRSMGIHTNNNLQNGKMVITSSQATAKFGSNQNLIVRGYYKVTDYKAIGSDPWWQIGSNASSGASGKKTGNQTSWTYFKITWNTSKDLNFEFWNCNGYMYLANLTIENSSGTILYDLSTDSTISGYQNEFPYTGGSGSIWYITHEADFNFMDMSNTAVKTASTPKQYSVKITENSKALSTSNRTMGIHAAHGLQNGKMVITSAQATAKFGANQTMIVRGYYKVTGYTKIGDSDFYSIGTNATSGAIKTTGNQESWRYFKLTWNTNTDLNFEFWNANGFMYLGNLTIENSSGSIKYDLSTDANLYKDGGYYNDFPRDPSIWYITHEADFNFMDMSNTAVKTTATPKQYDQDWDYLKFSMWYASGTLEIADLTIYHYVNGQKVIDYSMETHSVFGSDQTRTNTNTTSFAGIWGSWEWVSGGNINFTIDIDYQRKNTLYDTNYVVPKFTESAG